MQNHPTLTALQSHFHDFSALPFPKGAPGNIADWKSALQALTKYEAGVVQIAYAYLKGEKIDPEKVLASTELRTALVNTPQKTSEEIEYAKRLENYLKAISHLADLIATCANELGNPLPSIPSSS